MYAYAPAAGVNVTDRWPGPLNVSVAAIDEPPASLNVTSCETPESWLSSVTVITEPAGALSDDFVKRMLRATMLSEITLGG
jgi:hypothetical protein